MCFHPGPAKSGGISPLKAHRAFLSFPPSTGTSSYWLLATNPRVSSLKSATPLPLSSSSSSLHLCLVMRRSPGTCWVAGLLFLPFPAGRSLDLAHSPARRHTTGGSETQQHQVVPGACDASSGPAACTEAVAMGSPPIPCPQAFSDASREMKQWKKSALGDPQ